MEVELAPQPVPGTLCYAQLELVLRFDAPLSRACAGEIPWPLSLDWLIELTDASLPLSPI